MGVAKVVRNWTIIHHWKQWGSLSELKQAKALYKENKGAVKLEQSPVMMDSRTIHRTPPPKRASFLTGSG
jgi:hypothetical protein